MRRLSVALCLLFVSSALAQKDPKKEPPRKEPAKKEAPKAEPPKKVEPDEPAEPKVVEPKDEPLKTDSPFDLVRKLRENGLIDLATQRLNELRDKPGLLPADQAPLILFEIAKNKLEEAGRETDDTRRNGHIVQAREAFTGFIQAHPKHPRVAQANVEIARLYALQAKAQLSRANRAEGEEAKANAFSLARKPFDEAIDRYKRATTTLDEAIKKLPKDDAQAGELTDAKQQAELDTAILEFEKAKTFTTDGERQQRGDGIVKAKKMFSALADKYAGGRVGYLADVWQQQCDYENGDPRAAQLIARMVTAQRANKAAADAVRLAGYFGIQHAFETEDAKDSTPAGKFQRTDRAAEAWLRAYPEFRNTPEGLGALYRRGLMKDSQVWMPGGGIQFAAPPKPKTGAKKDDPEAPAVAPKITGISASAKLLLEEANKIFKALEDSDNEYTERAHRRRLRNQLAIMEGEGRGGDPQPRSINTLEQGVLYAQVQQARMLSPQAPDGRKLDGDEADKEVERRTRLAIQFLERALQKSTPRDDPRDVFDAQMLLVLFLTKSDRAVEAAVIGEALARNNPRAPKAATAAQLAIYAYNTALGRLKQRGAPAEDQEADLERLRRLGAFAVKTWPTDGPTDAIRHVLAFYQGRAKDLEGAWKTYSEITPGYTAAAQARLEMGAVMFELVKPQSKEEMAKYKEVVTANITRRAPQWQATIKALEAVPEPLESATADAESWARAKTQLAQLYLMANDYDKVDTTIKAVVERLPKFPRLDAAKRDDLTFGARALRYNGLQAKAADLIKAKEFAKVGEVVDADLAAMKKELGAKADPKEKEPGGNAAPNLDRMRKAQRGLLIAAMSAFVQDKKAEKANELIDLLEKTSGGLDSSVDVMRQLAGSIRAQIDELGKAGAKADADGLRASFGEFLDKIRGDDPGKLSSGVVLFLGQGYAAVDRHARAAELYETLITKPGLDPVKKREYQFLQARAYRQAGDKEGFEKATALMKEIVGNPIDPNPKAARGWGYGNMAIRKEYNALLEDQKFFRPALDNWRKLTRDRFARGLQPPVVKPDLKNQDLVIALGPAIDLAFHQPLVRTWFDFCFRGGLDAQSARRKEERNAYFDLYIETQRCSALAYASQDPARYKGGQEGINRGLENVAQGLFDLTSRNEDVSDANQDKIQDLLDKYPAAKKKFEALKAAAPKQ
ncbi:MAG TPA: hypothetical protein VM597_18295 [Gemmataceae bacterium]|nr:hypothetical protein [Gemmataceae bacterium]